MVLKVIFLSKLVGSTEYARSDYFQLVVCEYCNSLSYRCWLWQICDHIVITCLNTLYLFCHWHRMVVVSSHVGAQHAETESRTSKLGSCIFMIEQYCDTVQYTDQVPHWLIYLFGWFCIQSVPMLTTEHIVQALNIQLWCIVVFGARLSLSSSHVPSCFIFKGPWS